MKMRYPFWCEVALAGAVWWVALPAWGFLGRRMPMVTQPIIPPLCTGPAIAPGQTIKTMTPGDAHQCFVQAPYDETKGRAVYRFSMKYEPFQGWIVKTMNDLSKFLTNHHCGIRVWRKGNPAHVIAKEVGPVKGQNPISVTFDAPPGHYHIRFGRMNASTKEFAGGIDSDYIVRWLELVQAPPPGTSGPPPGSSPPPAAAVSPKVSVSPSSGGVGTTFTQVAEGCTPNGQVRLWFQYPNNTMNGDKNKIADSQGRMTQTYTRPKEAAKGKYWFWVEDLTSKRKSPRVPYEFK
jgi:hypothetical protein